MKEVVEEIRRTPRWKRWAPGVDFRCWAIGVEFHNIEEFGTIMELKFFPLKILVTVRLEN